MLFTNNSIYNVWANSRTNFYNKGDIMKMHRKIKQRTNRRLLGGIMVVQFDEIQKAEHYNVHESGLECIDVIENLSFCLGNAIKYVWRAGLKSENRNIDLHKAIYYLEREQKRLESMEYMSADINISNECITKLSLSQDFLGLFFRNIKSLAMHDKKIWYMVFDDDENHVLLRYLIKLIKQELSK